MLVSEAKRRRAGANVRSADRRDRDPAWERREYAKCYRSAAYFIHHYCWVYDATKRDWLPFHLWAAQVGVLRVLAVQQLVVILKARQLGLTWLVLGWFLWLMIFRAASTVLLFSRRDDEAQHLLQERLRGMYMRLPPFLQCRRVLVDNGHELRLSNGSVAMAFPTTGGDSYTATAVLVDEADLIPNLPRFMGSVKPTIDAGGQMILLSRVDKEKPNSLFKRVYRGAKAGENDWFPVFLPWFARPGRDEAWYLAQKVDSEVNHGSLDYLWEQYPGKDSEALAPPQLGKRIPLKWLEPAYTELKGLPVEVLPAALAVPGLSVYRLPVRGEDYVIGVDTAEGNPTSDDSAFTVMDLAGDEVAKFAGKYEPAALAALVDGVGRAYNNAPVLPERNNHGHAFILWMREHSALRVLFGHDHKPGWLSSDLGKRILYARAADQFKNGECQVHSTETYLQLASIEGGTLRAPEGELDDLADSYALAQSARALVLGIPEREAGPGSVSGRTT